MHFTQFHNTTLSVNPGLTGIFNGDQRFLVAYRGQWHEANSPYSTFFGMFDQKYYNRKLKRAFLGYGGTISYDRAGDSKLALIQVNLNGSYTYTIDMENFLTGGLMVGVAQRAFQFGGVSWDSQYDRGEGRYDPTLSAGENLNDGGYLYPDFGLGLNYRGQKTGRRSSVDVGAALFHIHKPNQSFEDQGVSKLEPKANFYLMQNLQVSPTVDLYWNGLAQIQSKYLEGLGGLGVRYHIDQRRGKELAIQAGAAFRFNAIGDAAIAMAEVHYQYLRLGFSYDINVSGFKQATNRNGGPEVTLRYVVHFVKPIPVFRVCPII
jgi:type IX secretion system PorP/SprF family membrane protein